MLRLLAQPNKAHVVERDIAIVDTIVVSVTVEVDDRLGVAARPGRATARAKGSDVLEVDPLETHRLHKPASRTAHCQSMQRMSGCK